MKKQIRKRQSSIAAKPLVGNDVFLAWYHDGHWDSAPRLVAVCASRTVAMKTNRAHKKNHVYGEDGKNVPKWWVSTEKIITY